MRQVSPLPTPSDPPCAVGTETTSHLLQMQSVNLRLLANYSEHLEIAVFNCPDATGPSCDSKELLKYRRLLCSMDAYKVLAILWKESKFVSIAACAESGLPKQFDGDITAHALAVRLAEAPDEVSALNSRIRLIGLGAAAYRLVSRAELSKTKCVLCGTERLHHFMSDLSKKNLLAVAGLVPLFNDAIAPVSRPAFEMGDKK